MPNISLIRKSLCAQNWIKDLSLYIFFLLPGRVQYGQAGTEEEKNREEKQAVTEGERKR